MIKNMTRKGLAIGSAAALIVAGFAGALPAQAATSVTLNASAGSQAATQNGILGQTFNMASTAVGATAGSTAVKYYVAGASASELVVEGRFVTSLTGAGSYSAVTPTDKTDGLDKAATIVAPAWTVGNFFQMNISLDSSVTATRTITITPFVDNVVANDAITAGEFAGTPITLTFHKASELTATTVLAPVNAGATSLKATVVLDKDINHQSIGGGVFVRFAKDGVELGVETASFVAADAAMVATHTHTAVASSVYTAQARVGGNAAANNSGTASVVTATAGSIHTLSALAVDKGTSYLASGNKVRAGAGSIVVSTEATTAAGAAVVGATVTFTIEEVSNGSLDAGATVTAGGKTLSGAPATIQKTTVDVVTDADGVAELAISYAGVKNANTFKVTTSAFSATGVAAGSSNITFTGEDSVATAIVDVNNLGGANGDSAVHASTAGGNVSVAYQVVDQFGQAPAGTHRLRVAYKTGSDAINSTLAVTAGAANLSISDNSSAAGAHTATATVERLGTDGSTWTAVGSVSAASTIQVVSALPAGTRVTVTETPDSTATANLNVLSSAALATVDARLSRDSRALPALGSQSVLSGVVYGATGAVQAGASVTLSSPNLMFVTNAGTAASAHYSLGSTTIKTDANGAFGDVQVLSTTAGKHTVTVTSGSGTTTTDVFFGAAADNAGSKVTITAPASVLPGSTLQVSAVVTDKFGNAVNTTTGDATVAITYTGPGLVVGTLPTETDANGRVQLSVLMGSNDRGTFSVTVTYKKAANTPDADLIASTANVTVGSVAAVAGQARGWTKDMGDGTVKLYARDLVGAGKVTFYHNGNEVAWIRAIDATDPKLNVLSDGMVRTRTLVSGRNVFEIKVNGVQLVRRIATGS
jgi:hypothetical protein